MCAETAAKTDPWTISRLLTWTRGHFEQHSVDEPRLAAEILLAHALGCERIRLYTRFDEVPRPDQLDVYRDLVRRAAKHEPIAYLVASKEFYSLSFEVSPAVLIPRAETEILVEKAIDYCRARYGADGVVNLLDVGTGSGCIAIALLKHLPAARVVATDVSAEALELVRRNAERHKVSERLQLVEADRLNFDPEVKPDEGFAVLVSNPPYVAAEEMAQLDANVRDYEPATALTDGADGLSFFRSIAESASRWLQPDGAVFVEIGDGQADAVRASFGETGRWAHAGTWRDTTGPHERVLHFRLEA